MFIKKKDKKKKIVHEAPAHEPVSIVDGKSRRIISGDEYKAESDSNDISLIDVSPKTKIDKERKKKDKFWKRKDSASRIDEEFEDLDAIEDTLENRVPDDMEQYEAYLESVPEDVDTYQDQVPVDADTYQYPEEYEPDMVYEDAALGASQVETDLESVPEDVDNVLGQEDFEVEMIQSDVTPEVTEEQISEAEQTNQDSNKTFKSGLNDAKTKFFAIKDKYLKKETWQELLKRAIPASPEGVDTLTDYFMRVLIFLFPLYIYETGGFMGINGKDILFGFVILIMALWCGFQGVKANLFRKYASGWSGIALGASFVLIAITFIRQVAKLETEIPHTYLYLGCFLVAFSSIFVGKCSRYYLQLFVTAISLVYISVYRYLFTIKATLLGSENLISSAGRFVPLLMLGTATASLLYLTEKKKNYEKLYLVIIAAGEVLLFLYGNMVSFVITLLFIIGLQYISEPTIRFMKKNMILLFMFGFCASNAPLLTYFKVPGLNKTFDLEYSIYIDIVIAVLGLVVTNYWEKLPKDKDENTALMPVFSKWYKRVLGLIMVLLAISFVFGSRGDKLQNAFGGKAMSGFSISLWNSVSSSSGELWHVMAKYGLMGVMIMLVLGMIIFKNIAVVWGKGELDEVSRGYVIIAIMFLLQSFFFPYAATSTPVFMIFVGLAISGHHLEKVATAEAEISDFAQPAILNEAIAQFGSDVKEARKLKGRAKFSRYANIAAYSVAAAMLAGLILLATAGLYRVITPVTKRGADVESLVEVAMIHREEALLAAALEASNEELAAAEATSAEEEDLVAAVEVSQAEPVKEESAEAASSASSEEKTEEENPFADILAGISGGDYKIFDPNADYEEVNEEVSGKNGPVNLRTLPSLEGDVEVVHKLTEDEKVLRVGIGENGWSKVMFEDQVLYAVTDYLVKADELAGAEEDERAQEEVTQEAQNQEAQEEQAQGQEEPAQGQEEQAKAQEEPAAAEDEGKETKPAEPPKGSANYTVYLSDDKKSISLWSAGKQYGTMSVTNEEGKVMELVNNGVLTTGTGKNEKKYLNITTARDITKPMTLNVDAGFIEAVRNMGYSGIYFNKTINNW